MKFVQRLVELRTAAVPNVTAVYRIDGIFNVVARPTAIRHSITTKIFTFHR